MIVRETKKAVGTVVDDTALGEKLKKEHRHLADTHDESFLTSLEDDKPSILPRSLFMIGSFPPEENSDQAFTSKPKTCKPWSKAPVSPSRIEKLALLLVLANFASII